MVDQMGSIRIPAFALLDLVDVATQTLQHQYRGECPDWTQPDARDSTCAACQVIMRVEKHIAKRLGVTT